MTDSNKDAPPPQKKKDFEDPGNSFFIGSCTEYAVQATFYVIIADIRLSAQMLRLVINTDWIARHQAKLQGARMPGDARIRWQTWRHTGCHPTAREVRLTVDG